MCGENGELKRSLKQKTIKAIAGDMGGFAAKYARFRTGTITVETLICIAPITKWWRGTCAADSGAAYGWTTLYDYEFLALSLEALSKMVKKAK
jgi:hypothetical protein